MSDLRICGRVIALLFAGLLITSEAVAQNGPEFDALGRPQWPCVYRYLVNVGHRWDVFFTLELKTEREDQDYEILGNITVTSAKKASSIGEAMEELLLYLPGFRYAWSREDRRVIHLIDTRLDDVKGYALKQRADIKYKGLLRELPDALGAKVDAILRSRQTGFRLANLKGPDWITRITIEAKKLDVRTILTTACPLDQYPRFLWIAETYPVYEGLKTSVYYKGPMTSEEEEDRRRNTPPPVATKKWPGTDGLSASRD